MRFKQIDIVLDKPYIDIKLASMTDIKRKLIEEIEKIDNDAILSQLTELVSVSNDSIQIEFTSEQISKIQESQRQIEKGEFKSHEEVMKQIDND